MTFNRNKIREYIKKQLGRDPQDNFDIGEIYKGTVLINVRYTADQKGIFPVYIPLEKAV